MKSKIIFVLILLSLVFNIFHDLLIHNQLKADSSKTVMIDGFKPLKHYPVCDLHKVFHFLAILAPFYSVVSSSMVSRQLIFVEVVPPQTILESSFKPPRT
jgi:hypothetical protein